MLTVLSAAALLGTSGLFIKAVDLHPAQITFIRSALPTLYFAVLFALQKNPVLKKLSPAVLLGSLLNALRLFLYFLGFKLTTMGNVVVIFYTWPLFAYLFSLIFFKEKISFKKALLLVTAFAGILLVYSTSSFSFESRDFLGMAAVTLSALLYTFSILIFKKTSHRYTRQETTFFQNFLSTLFYLPAILLIQPLPDLRETAVISVYAVLIGIVAFSLFFTALKKLPASLAAHLTYMEVVSALLLSHFVLGEPLQPELLAGALLILGSLVGVSRPAKA